MPIIFFVGQGVTLKSINYEYKNGKYVKNNFIELLKKLDEVIIPDISYHHVYYYQKTDFVGWKDRYNVVDNININDIYITKFIENLKVNNKQKFILMGHSDGIYFAMEFARQYPNLVKHIISLDGSWISTKLCKQRLHNWEKQGKKVKTIKTQYELDELVNKIKFEDNNDIYIKQILDHTRLEHTNECIKNNYENIIKQIDYTIFRDFNGTVDNDINKQFNEYAVEEHNILLNLSDKYRIYWLVNATHDIWFDNLYKKQILEQIQSIINHKRQTGGTTYHHKYVEYKSKYLALKDKLTKILKGGSVIFHISGPQGSGKSTLGNKLLDLFGHNIYVKDLDDLFNEFTQSTTKDYQTYINEFIEKHQDRSIIFVGLDADKCLGPTEFYQTKQSDKYYDLHAKYKFYIDLPQEQILKQRFLRQIDKLYERKEWFFDTWLKDPKTINEKLKRFIDLEGWKFEIESCAELYKRRGYKFLHPDDILNEITNFFT
jgi:adenylate kinase family enzyme